MNPEFSYLFPHPWALAMILAMFLVLLTVQCQH
jgi:hypothetical protein